MMKRGDVVCSVAGKDAGLLMAVLRTDENGVWVADGRLRPLDHPKRKNPRHVSVTAMVVGETSMATNRELRRALAALQQQSKKAGSTENGVC